MAITDEQPQTGASQELLGRARAGDALAFCRLLEPLQTRLLRQATALNGDVSMAEDLVSETRLRAWKHLSRYNESCRLSTWLYAILLHCHPETARRARSRPASLARLSSSEAGEIHKQHEKNTSAEPSPAEAAAQKETILELNRCVEMLPEKHRDIIRLRFFEDGNPLVYRRTEDGMFLLYSVGWNETDDGGKIVSAKDDLGNPTQGDWVWKNSVTPD